MNGPTVKPRVYGKPRILSPYVKEELSKPPGRNRTFSMVQCLKNLGQCNTYDNSQLSIAQLQKKEMQVSDDKTASQSFSLLLR